MYRSSVSVLGCQESKVFMYVFCCVYKFWIICSDTIVILYSILLPLFVSDHLKDLLTTFDVSNLPLKSACIQEAQLK